jgi:N-acetylornithine carbamoyltransferase
VTADAYQNGEFLKAAEVKKSMAIPGWTANADRMARTDSAIYTHPMPVDRGSEVTDEIASGPRSAIYDVAENRLHVQKALMALTMGNL